MRSLRKHTFCGFSPYFRASGSHSQLLPLSAQKLIYTKKKFRKAQFSKLFLLIGHPTLLTYRTKRTILSRKKLLFWGLFSLFFKQTTSLKIVSACRLREQNYIYAVFPLLPVALMRSARPQNRHWCWQAYRCRPSPSPAHKYSYLLRVLLQRSNILPPVREWYAHDGCHRRIQCS